MDNQKNLLLAVIFSMIVLIGFDFFFKPKRESSEQKTNNQNQFIEKSDSDIPTINKKDRIIAKFLFDSIFVDAFKTQVIYKANDYHYQ